MKVFLICAFLLVAAIGFCQTDSISSPLDEVIIKSNRIQTGFDEESANIVVINRQAIVSAPVVNVVDVLRYYAGIDIRQRGANGVQTDPGIRGSTFDQVLILVNGVKISDPQTGHHSLNLPVDINNIERIEIIKGPAARIYGQNAFAGAINIITKTPNESELNLQATAGDFGLWGGKVGGAIKGNRVGISGSVSHDQSDGYQYNTDYKMTNYFLQSDVELRKGQVSALAGLTNRRFGANGFYAGTNFRDQYEEVMTSMVSVQYDLQKAGKWSIQPRVYWRRNHDSYIFIRQNPSFYHNIHTGNTIGGEFNSTFTSSIGTTGLGIDINKVTLESNNLGDRDRFVTTIFLEQRMLAFKRRMDLTPGFQLNYYSDFGLNFFPGINVGYLLSSRYKFFGNVGYTYRVPTFTDLYYSDPANLANPNLRPEKALSYEVGVKVGSNPAYNSQVSYFVREGKDVIDWTRQNQADPWSPDNISEVTIGGLDFSFTVRPSVLKNRPDLLIQNATVNYTYIGTAKTTAEGVGYSKYALEYLTHQFSMNVQLRYLRWLSHSIFYRYSDRVNLPDYSVFDTRINFSVAQFNAFIDVTNIFDIRYQETNLVTLPGRWIKGGVSYRIPFSRN